MGTGLEVGGLEMRMRTSTACISAGWPWSIEHTGKNSFANEHLAAAPLGKQGSARQNSIPKWDVAQRSRRWVSRRRNNEDPVPPTQPAHTLRDATKAELAQNKGMGKEG